MMPSVLQLFAGARLPRVGGDACEVVIGRRELGPMILAEVHCSGRHQPEDTAILVFRPASAETGR